MSDQSLTSQTSFTTDCDFFCCALIYKTSFSVALCALSGICRHNGAADTDQYLFKLCELHRELADFIDEQMCFNPAHEIYQLIRKCFATSLAPYNLNKDIYMYQQKSIFRLSLILIATAVSNTSLAGFYKEDSQWNNLEIPVCWEGTARDPDLYSKVATQIEYTEKRYWVKNAVRDTWEKHSDVRFTEWDVCTDSEPGVHLFIQDIEGEDYPNQTMAVGNALDGWNFGVRLNFDYINRHSEICGDLDKIQDCIEGTAVHEFGHVLGFLHEDHRNEAPSLEEASNSGNPNHRDNGCELESAGQTPGLDFGEYQYDSVMNNCNRNWQNGILSGGDIAMLRAFYLEEKRPISNHIADFNGDGIGDAVGVNLSNGTANVALFGQDTQVASQTNPLYGVSRSRWSLKGFGDFDGNGTSETLWRDRANGDVIIHYPFRTVVLQTSVIQDWKIQGVGDFNGDGRSDILWQNHTSGQRYIYIVNGDVWHGGNVSLVNDEFWKVLGIRDFNFDGKDDILWRNISTGENWMYLMDGFTVAESKRINHASEEWEIIGVTQAPATVYPQIIWRNTVDNTHWRYYMVGASIYRHNRYPQILPSIEWNLKLARDFDGDGDIDYLIVNPTTGEKQMVRMSNNQIELRFPNFKLLPNHEDVIM